MKTLFQSVIFLLPLILGQMTHANELVFLNDYNSADSIDVSRAPQPEVLLQGGDVRVIWRDIALYLRSRNETADIYDNRVEQESPEDKAKRTVVEGLRETARESALDFVNGQREEPLSLSELSGRMLRTLESRSEFSNEEKKSEGFLFSYKQWIQFDLSFMLDAGALHHQLAKAEENAKERKERDRIQRERKRKVAEERESREREQIEESRRKDEEEKGRLTNLDRIQWGGDARRPTVVDWPEEVLARLPVKVLARLPVEVLEQLPEKLRLSVYMSSMMVTIPAGLFRMGDLTGNGNDDEKPVHSVRVPAFRMGIHEVTNAMYRQYDPDHDSGEFRGNTLNDPQQPVVEVSWNDANDYLEWLNRTLKPEKPYRLPTEAEWEYAARGGTTTRYWWGEDRENKEACHYANVLTPSTKRLFDFGWESFHCEEGYKVNAPVGQFVANPYHLTDMLGNVSEWTSSEYSRRYEGSEQRPSHQGHESGRRVFRGGAWGNEPGGLRAANRFNGGPPGLRYFDIGFRIAQDL